MRTNSTSSFGSSVNLEEVISSVSTVTSSDVDAEHSKRLKLYGKFFATRLIQILVQSRTNEKISIPCVATQLQNDWFNIRVDELGEVAAQIKRSLTKFPPSIPQMCVDFFLYTVDQETLPLESWCFSVDDSEKTSSSDHKSDIYHQLGTLLKSCMTAARMTPMHRYYVKKQSADTFVILYRIVGSASTIDLGSEAKRISLGHLPTSLGVFKLDLAYRTRMEIDRTITPSLDNTESFQQVSTISPENTPDSGHMIGSPMSFGMCSHFSASPPSFSPVSSPYDDPYLMKSPANFRPARSRTTSVASDGEPATVGSAPNKEKPSNLQHSLKMIPKNMPFANLLAVSFTGTLFPVPEENKNTAEHDSGATNKGGSDSSGSTIVASDSGSVDSDDEQSNAQNADGNGSDDDFDLDPTTRERKVTMVPLQRASGLTHSQGTVVGPDVDMSATIRDVASRSPERDYLSSHDDVDAAETVEGDCDTGAGDVTISGSGANTSLDSGLLDRTLSSEGGVKESDDDSFVKIPVFLSNDSEAAVDDSQSNLGDLISSCKAPPILSFAAEDFSAIEQELDHFSLNQGLFDRFVAEIRETVDDCDD